MDCMDLKTGDNYFSDNSSNKSLRIVLQPQVTLKSNFVLKINLYFLELLWPIQPDNVNTDQGHLCQVQHNV